MSTRCMILFQDDDFPTTNPPKVQFYQHSDGYPSNVAKDIADFFAKWNRVHPGVDYHDSGGVAAQYINFAMDRSFRSMVRCAVRFKKRAKAKDDAYGIESAQNMAKDFRERQRYMGFRVVPHGQFHDDIEWCYIVTPTRVHVYHTMHNKRGDYNDFEVRARKDNWIVVSTEEEEFELRQGRFPERLGVRPDQSLWLQEVQKYVEEDERKFGPLPGKGSQLALTR